MGWWGGGSAGSRIIMIKQFNLLKEIILEVDIIMGSYKNIKLAHKGGNGRQV